MPIGVTPITRIRSQPPTARRANRAKSHEQTRRHRWTLFPPRPCSIPELRTVLATSHDRWCGLGRPASGVAGRPAARAAQTATAAPAWVLAHQAMHVLPHARQCTAPSFRRKRTHSGFSRFCGFSFQLPTGPAAGHFRQNRRRPSPECRLSDMCALRAGCACSNRHFANN